MEADQVAMVTGGARGIGRAIVEALLGKGFKVSANNNNGNNNNTPIFNVYNKQSYGIFD